MPLPSNEMADSIKNPSHRSTVKLAPTTGKSLAFTNDKWTFFLRPFNHGWLMLGVIGKVPAQQINGPLTITQLY